MAAYMSFMLVRFGIIAAVVAVVIIVGFTVAIVLKRKGKLGEARRYVEPVARRALDSRPSSSRSNRGGRQRRGVSDWRNAAARFTLDYIDKNDTDEHRGNERR